MPLPVWYLKSDPKPAWTELSLQRRRQLLRCFRENIKVATRWGDVKAILINEQRIEESVGPLDKQ